MPNSPVVEQRAADQDAAIEAAFIAGTLPEEDRRTPLGETRAVLDALPVGSRVEWEKYPEGERWTVYRGPGISQHGDGATLARAIRLIGAKYEHVLDGDGKQTPRMILVDESGTPILPD